MENHFIHEPSVYKRDLNVLKHYSEDAALYLHKRTGQDLEMCRQWVREKTAPGGEMGVTDPETLILTKEKEGERTLTTVSLNSYLRDVEENRRLISPTMAVYHHPNHTPSLLADFIGINIQKRKKSKDEMFAADSRGDKVMKEYKNNEQQSAKIKNNSLSGAQASKHTILRNKSAHSSLTSTCRSATSYGNANNEKFLMGNRHYWAPDVVKANIVSIIRSTDYPALQRAIDHHGIRHPSVEETMECIRYSTDLYWRNPAQLEEINQLVLSLSDIERSAFVYSGDLYHLAKHNDSLVREFLGRLAVKASEPIDNPDDYIPYMDADMKALVSLLCADEMGSTDEKKGTLPVLKVQNPHGYAIVGATAKKIMDVLDEYKYLIQGLWRVDTLPASIAHIRSSVRRSAVTSDTDSTIFTTQYWTEWYVGKIDFSEISNNISYVMVYLASQSIIHVLAKLSAGLGVVAEQIHDLNMKNEYNFPVFCLTSMAKHYFAYMSAKEGNVFDEFDTEIKGVQLKDSNAPPHVMDEFRKTLRWVMDQVMSGDGLSMQELYHRIGVIENGIRTSVLKGDSTYLTSAQVKDAGSYTNPQSSPYQHYVFWQDVFAPKYGDAPEPPYSAIKVAINNKSQTSIREWIQSIKDQELARRLDEHLKAYNRTGVTSLLLPRPVIEVTGIPEEVIQAMDLRGLIFNTVRPFYLLLETLGVYMMNDNNTKLVSDHLNVNPQYAQLLSD